MIVSLSSRGQEVLVVPAIVSVDAPRRPGLIAPRQLLGPLVGDRIVLWVCRGRVYCVVIVVIVGRDTICVSVRPVCWYVG